MIVSWNWLKDYVPLTMTPAEWAHRLTMAGLNHESTSSVGDDWAIDLEVTSNRPDCLGHLGVARETSVLWNVKLTIPRPRPTVAAATAASACQVRIDCRDLCRRYSARILRGVKIGRSPAWLENRLRTLGIAVINNVVDVTNYVMLECGQPLHAFDLDRLHGQQIIVREARPEEEFLAIDHRTYKLQAGMCVIADADRPLALGGVMGGADSEVSAGTTNVLIEAADFAPLSIRTTARALRLHSPSSYRFERGVDPEMTDWASRRACELILQTAGGELLSGAIDVQATTAPTLPLVKFRFAQLERVLGIPLPVDEVTRILEALGCELQQKNLDEATWKPPTWRRDLTREIDFIEEVARIHGYDQIPEDVGVPMAASHRTDDDRVLSRVRQTLVACGFYEAMTPSVVDAPTSSAFSPWTDAAPITSSTPMLRGADQLRRSLIPSLLAARRTNESLANPHIELFETANVYLGQGQGLPHEEKMLALTSSEEFASLKGVIEAIVQACGIRAKLEATSLPAASRDLLDARASCELSLAGARLGFLGQVHAAGLKAFGLRRPTTVAEVKLSLLGAQANLVPQYVELSPYPAITYDLNLIVAEEVRWADLADTVRRSGGGNLEEVQYRETYRDPQQKDGVDKKRLIFSLLLRSATDTLTGEQAEAVRDRIVAACAAAHQAQLLG